MPTYSVTAPDGRKLKITGDTPPSEQELDQIFKESSQPVQPESKPLINRAIDTAKSIGEVLGQVSYGAQESMGAEYGLEKPKTSSQELARQIGNVAGYFVDPTQMGKIPYEAAGLGLKVAGATKAGQKLIQPIKKTGELIGKGAGKLISFTGSLSDEAIKTAWENPDVRNFSGSMKTVYRKIGNKIADGINHLIDQSATAVKAEKTALKDYDKIDVSNMINDFYGRYLQSGEGRISALTPTETSLIQKHIDDLQKINDGGAGLNELHQIKSNIQSDIKNWNKGTIQEKTTEGIKVLKEMQGQINNTLRQLSPDYAKVNDKASKVFSQIEKVKPEIQEKYFGTKIKRIAFNPDDFTYEELQKIDNMLPKNMRFMNDINKARAIEEFNQITPGKGGGSGSSEGIRNLIRSKIITSKSDSGAMGLLTKLATFGLSSPYAVKKEMSAVQAIPKYLKKPLPLIARKSIEGIDSGINYLTGGK